MLERFWSKNEVFADEKYARWCNENSLGYVFNFFKGTDKSNDFNVLHRVNCRKLDIRGKSTTYEKVCSNSKEKLEEFANQYRGLNKWKQCQVCFPDD